MTKGVGHHVQTNEAGYFPISAKRNSVRVFL